MHSFVMSQLKPNWMEDSDVCHLYIFLLLSLISIFCLEGRTQYGQGKQHVSMLPLCVIHVSSDVLVVVCTRPNQVQDQLLEIQ